MLKFLANRPTFLALAGAISLSFASFAMSAGANAADLEKCFGVAKAGQDEGSTEADIPGMSTVDYDGHAYKWVTKGTCEEKSTPFGAGSLRPVANRPPQNR